MPPQQSSQSMIPQPQPQSSYGIQNTSDYVNYDPRQGPTQIPSQYGSQTAQHGNNSIPPYFNSYNQPPLPPQNIQYQSQNPEYPPQHYQYNNGSYPPPTEYPPNHQHHPHQHHQLPPSGGQRYPPMGPESYDNPSSGYSKFPGRGGPSRPGDWICHKCNNNNFSWRPECKQCSSVRTERDQVVEDKPHYSGKHHYQHNTHPRQNLPPDWLCSKCSFRNFAKRTECKQCGADRGNSQIVPSTPALPKDGYHERRHERSERPY